MPFAAAVIDPHGVNTDRLFEAIPAVEFGHAFVVRHTISSFGVLTLIVCAGIHCVQGGGTVRPGHAPVRQKAPKKFYIELDKDSSIWYYIPNAVPKREITACMISPLEPAAEPSA